MTSPTLSPLLNTILSSGSRNVEEVKNFSLNGTGENSVERTTVFKPIIDYLLLVILVVIMLSMGCEITWENLLGHIKKPIGIFIGMISQFVVMPLIAYSLMQSISVSGLYATGILIISSCPGGVLSNAFTYFCDGDLSLSVAMTTFSTLLAMGMMPLNVWIYGRSLETGTLVIPYVKLALSLISVTSPVIVGMLLKWKVPKVAYYVTKIGSYVGIIMVIACIILEVIVFPNMFTGVPSKLYGIVLTLPFIGLTLGFVSAALFKQSMAIRRTIAIECGVQNVPTALTIVSLSFPVEQQEDIILLPWLYGFAMITGSSVTCIAFQIYKRIVARQLAKKLKDVDAKQNDVVEKDCTIATIKLDDIQTDMVKKPI